MTTKSVHESVQEYYGKTLSKTDDLKTNACCTMTAPPARIMNALKNVHDEVRAKYYGCGITLPHAVEGCHILDLGSGSGQDCYIASQLVGKNGSVIGVDMTDEQLAVANEYKNYHAEKFGFGNVNFLKGNIEKLDQLDIKQNSLDIIISNCVINLTQDKAKVLRDAFSLLKEGGEMYFSDVYCDRRIPQELQDDEVLYGECLSGALYWNDFLRLAKEAGFKDPRVVESSEILPSNSELENKIEGYKFYSVTYRLFKIKELESDCEDFGHTVTYKGTIDDQSEEFKMDEHHIFKTGKETKVCGNSYLMLNATRFKDHFAFSGDFSTHYGIFEGCGGSAPFKETTPAQAGRCC